MTSRLDKYVSEDGEEEGEDGEEVGEAVVVSSSGMAEALEVGNSTRCEWQGMRSASITQ